MDILITYPPTISGGDLIIDDWVIVITHPFTISGGDLVKDDCDIMITNPLTISGGDLIMMTRIVGYSDHLLPYYQWW